MLIAGLKEHRARSLARTADGIHSALLELTLFSDKKCKAPDSTVMHFFSPTAPPPLAKAFR